MNRLLVVRVAGGMLALLLVAAVLAPVLWWDPTEVRGGGAGWQELAEWSELTSNKEDPERAEQLAEGFQVMRSHRGVAWYTAQDEDGTCWALSLEPLERLPREAPDAFWCGPNEPGEVDAGGDDTG